MQKIQVGRLLSSNIRSCVVGCPPSQEFPGLGTLVSVPLGAQEAAFGLVSDIRIEDDGLVRQLATSAQVDEAVIQDNRQNRNVPVEISVLFIGCQQSGKISHLLPPRPPLSLDTMYTCDAQELVAFTSSGRFGYLRHILEAQPLPGSDLLAAHLLQAGRVHHSHGSSDWYPRALEALITLLRDDYPRLMSCLGAASDVEQELKNSQAG